MFTSHSNEKSNSTYDEEQPNKLIKMFPYKLEKHYKANNDHDFFYWYFDKTKQPYDCVIAAKLSLDICEDEEAGALLLGQYASVLKGAYRVNFEHRDPFSKKFQLRIPFKSIQNIEAFILEAEAKETRKLEEASKTEKSKMTEAVKVEKVEKIEKLVLTTTTTTNTTTTVTPTVTSTSSSHVQNPFILYSPNKTFKVSAMVCIETLKLQGQDDLVSLQDNQAAAVDYVQRSLEKMPTEDLPIFEGKIIDLAQDPINDTLKSLRFLSYLRAIELPVIGIIHLDIAPAYQKILELIKNERQKRNVQCEEYAPKNLYAIN